MKKIVIAALIGILWSSFVCAQPYGPGASPKVSVTTLYFSPTSAGNGADTTEDTLQTYTTIANQLVVPGEKLHIIAGGIFAASTDTKTVRLRINGGAAIFFPVGSAVGQTKWYIEMWLIKTATNAQAYVGMNSNGVSLFIPGTGTSAITDSTPITILISGQNSTNSVLNSITCQIMDIEYIH